MLAVYRLGVYVPTPGIDTSALGKLLAPGTIFDVINIFSGGALKQFSVFALGIMPYISVSIIFQLLTVAVPALEKLQKEGEQGRKKITQYTRYGTILLSFAQGFGISYGLAGQGVLLPGVGGMTFFISTAVTLAAGTGFLMWLGEQITERGIGNGISLIIFAGIVANVPTAFRSAFSLKDQFGGPFGLLLLFAFIFAIAFAIVYVERAQRRIPIHHAKKMVGRKMYGASSNYLPLKVNTAGVIPPIFASSIILFPATMAKFIENPKIQLVAQSLTNGALHTLVYAGLIIFFCFFYTAVTSNPDQTAENIQKSGGFIPGIRPGKATAEYIDKVMSRITVVGAIYITIVCVLPELLVSRKIPADIAFTFGGTSVLIMIGVAMDTVSQVEAHLMNRNYEGFLGAKSGKFKGRRSRA